MRKTSLSFLALFGAALLFPVVAFAQPLIYSNGGLNPQALSNSGAAAPAGFFWSEVQNDNGNTSESNASAGYSVHQGTFRLADDFVVPPGETWVLEAVEFHAYQTGTPPTPSPFTGYTLQVWNGRPGDAGAAVVFGDTTTNRLATSVNSTYFRIFNSAVPAPGTLPGTTRTIWRNRVTINPPLQLTAGTYWLDWDSTVSNAGSHFQPAVTLPGARGAPGWNGRQLTVSSSTWADAIDSGNPTTAPDLPQDFPFDLFGMSPATDPVFSNGFEDPT